MRVVFVTAPKLANGDSVDLTSQEVTARADLEQALNLQQILGFRGSPAGRCEFNLHLSNNLHCFRKQKGRFNFSLYNPIKQACP